MECTHKAKSSSPNERFWRHIGFQLALLTISCLVISLIVYGLVVVRHQTDLTESSLKHEGKVLANNIADAAAHHMLSDKLASLEQLILASAKFADVAAIQVLDKENWVISEVVHDKDLLPRAVYKPRTLEAPAEHRPESAQGKEGFVFWHPITIVQPLGWVRLEYRTDRISSLTKPIWQNAGIAILTAASFSVLLLLIFLRPYVKAIGDASAFAADLDRLSGQDFQPWQWTSELNKLGVALNHVSRKLYEQNVQRTRMEQDLRASRHAYQTLTDNVPGIIYRRSVQSDLKPQLLNNMFEPITGYRLEDLFDPEHVCIYSLVHSEDRTKIDTALEEALESGQPFEIEYRLQHKDGGIRFLLERGVIVQTDEQEAPFVDGIILDVTKRRLAETALHQREQDLALAQATAHLGSCVWDIRTGNESWSDEQTRLFGFQPDRFNPSHADFINGLHPDDRDWVLAAMEASLEDSAPFDLEFRILRPDHSTRYVHGQAVIARSESGEALLWQGTLLDVTDRKQAEQALYEEKERAQVTLYSIGDAVISTNTDGGVEYLNPAAEKLTGWALEEARGKPVKEVFNIINEETRRSAPDPVARCLREGIVIGLANHTLLISRAGPEYAVQDSAAPIRARDGTVLGVVLVFSDVTEARRMSHEMTHQASHDALTGLINRFEFERRLNRILDTTRIASTNNALCFLDLDQFKLINDSCGHIAGDELLRQVSMLLQESVRQRDTIARLGGDEFGLLMEHCSFEEAAIVAQKLTSVLGEYSFSWEDKRFSIGVSIGLVAVNEFSADAQSLLSAADSACYIAKERGRGQIHIYQPDDKDLARRHGEMLWAVRIPRALEGNRFRLFAQPIVMLTSDQEANTHYELLLRMIDEDGTVILPGAFLPAADRYNLTGLLDRWVIRTAFEWLAGQSEHVEGLSICAINLSGHSLNEETFLGFVQDQFKASQIPPEKICFEITETVAIANLARATSFVKALHSQGCLFALDDFGSGLSSFAYLKQLPVDMLKIDGLFVKDILRDPTDFAMVKAINEISKVMGKQTIAEFVENEEILGKLKQLNVDFVQGYGVGIPRPIEEMLLGR